jgi:DNA-binding HxlR family transcriptional regulator
MPKGSFSGMNCAIAQTLEQVGDWWTLLILRNAFCGMRRFHDFREHLGIATNVLAARLGKLVRVGILVRRASPDDGRARDYELTEKGLALYPVLIAITDWGERWAPDPKGPRILLRDRQTGAPIARIAVKSRDGRILRPCDVVARSGRGADDKIRQLVDRGWRNRRRTSKGRRKDTGKGASR